MRRLVFLILFILLTIVAIAWLTGIESPFTQTKTHGVLSKQGKSIILPVSGTNSVIETAKPASPSLLLGSNVDASRQSMNKLQATAAAAIPYLVSIEVKPGMKFPRDEVLKKLTGFGIVPDNDGGSGFFIDKEGTVLTNFSTILGGTAWVVRTSEWEEFDATLIGADAVSDLAVLRINKHGTVPIRWASSLPTFAEVLLLMGFDTEEGPRVLDVMVSSGILGNSSDEETNAWEHFLVGRESLEKQSGWLLLNMDGGTVGVVARINKSENGNIKESAVIPARSAMQIADALENAPLIRRIYLGAESKELNPAVAKFMGLKMESGLLVTNVRPESPLAEAGVVVGDIILTFGEVKVGTRRELHKLLANMAIGAKVPIEIMRGDEKLTLYVVLRENKSELQELMRLWLDVVFNSEKNAQPPTDQ